MRSKFNWFSDNNRRMRVGAVILFSKAYSRKTIYNHGRCFNWIGGENCLLILFYRGICREIMWKRKALARIERTQNGGHRWEPSIVNMTILFGMRVTHWVALSGIDARSRSIYNASCIWRCHWNVLEVKRSLDMRGLKQMINELFALFWNQKRFW